MRRGQARRIALVAKTPADARDVMIEHGDSSLLAVAPPGWRPTYEPSKRRVTWPNGAAATIYSSAEYETLRGPQHDTAWCDEFAAWHYPQETWDMLMMGLRLGDNPQCLVTTTPKPITPLKKILASPHTVVTGGSSYDNRANLPESWFTQVIARYEGTTLGQQELYARLLEEMPGAFWTRETIERSRVTAAEVPEPLTRIVVAIDPAVSSEEDSNETGIIVAGKARNGHAYVLEDRSGIYTPVVWARQAIQAYKTWKADRVVAETNQGGEMVEATLRVADPQVSYRGLYAARAKQNRAEPISGFYERGMVHHVGAFPALEDQLCTWVPGEDSPDRLDALVWALHELLESGGDTTALPYSVEQENPWP